MPDDAANSDSKEYKPSLEPAPKLNNKCYPSASRITSQWHKKSHTDHDEPKQNTTDQSTPETPADGEVNPNQNDTAEPAKGKLNITIVGLPKRVHAHTFKCQICKEVCHSEKEWNMHHKDNHAPLTCAVCNEVFDTPSGLHQHKYRHMDLKFTCETCGEQFPFESQLKDHCIKHLTGRGHACFAKNCGRSFKNKSSLIHHIKVHDGKTYTCPEEGCQYSNPDEHNLKSHMIGHTDTHWYSCMRCSQAFKHHT